MSRRRNYIEQTNPLRGLSPSSVASALESALRGDMARVQWMFHLIEQGDPDLLAIVERTVSVISEMDWDVKGESGEQRTGLTAAYNKIENLQAAINHLLLAEFRGFSIAQLQDNAGNPAPPGVATRVECLPHWCFVRDGLFGQFKWNPEAKSARFDSMPEVPLDAQRDHLLIHTADRPIDRIALCKYLRSNFALRAWADYIEKVADDGAFIIEPEGLEDESKRSMFAAASKDLRDGGGGSLPHGSEVVFSNTLRGLAPFDPYLRYLREQMVIAATGGMLTMLASPTGIGQGASDAHSETFRAIASKKSRDITEVFQRNFDKPFLQRNYPTEDIKAYFELAYRKDRDVGKMIEHAHVLAQIFKLDPTEWSDVTGYRLEDKPADTSEYGNLNSSVLNLETRRPGVSHDELVAAVHNALGTTPGSLMESALERVSAAFAADLEPLRERLEAIQSLPEAEYRHALRDLQGELPSLLPDNPAAATALADVFTAEYFNGMAAAAGVAT